MRTLLYVTTGERIKALRVSQGWTQDQLASRCDLRRTEINRLERGTNKGSSMSTREALARGFEVKIETLNGYLEGSVPLANMRGAIGETRAADQMDALEMAIVRLGGMLWPQAIEWARGLEEDLTELGWVMRLTAKQHELQAARRAENRAKPRAKKDKAPGRKAS